MNDDSLKELKFNTGTPKKFYLNKNDLNSEKLLIELPNDAINYVNTFKKNLTILKNNNIDTPKFFYFDKIKYLITVEYLGNNTLEKFFPNASKYDKKLLIEKIIIMLKNINLIKTNLHHLNIENYISCFNQYYKPHQEIDKAIINTKKYSFATIHGDFNSTNLIYNKEKIYIIDFNEMSFGPRLLDAISIFHDRALGLKLEESRNIIMNNFSPKESELESQEIISFVHKIGIMKYLSEKKKYNSYFKSLLNYYLKRFSEYCQLTKKNIVI